VLVDAGIAHEHDGGQELLEGLVLFALIDLFAGFDFAEARLLSRPRRTASSRKA